MSHVVQHRPGRRRCLCGQGPAAAVQDSGPGVHAVQADAEDGQRVAQFEVPLRRPGVTADRVAVSAARRTPPAAGRWATPRNRSAYRWKPVARRAGSVGPDQPHRRRRCPPPSSSRSASSGRLPRGPTGRPALVQPGWPPSAPARCRPGKLAGVSSRRRIAVPVVREGVPVPAGETSSTRPRWICPAGQPTVPGRARRPRRRRGASATIAGGCAGSAV